MIICQSCSNWNPEGTVFCPRCGMHPFEAMLINRKLNRGTIHRDWLVGADFGLGLPTGFVMKKAFGVLLVVALLLSPSSLAKCSRTSGGYSTRTSSSHSKSYCYTCTRDSSGRVKRSSQAKHDFMKSHPCPSTGKTSGPCKGYVVDHV
jgi:hypothetical protein